MNNYLTTIYLVSALIAALLVLRTVDDMMAMCARKPSHLQKAYKTMSLIIATLAVLTPFLNTGFVAYWVYSVYAHWGHNAKS